MKTKTLTIKQQYTQAVWALGQLDPIRDALWQISQITFLEDAGDHVEIIGSLRINGTYTGRRRQRFVVKRLEPAPEPKQGVLL
jgi:hypothetical protein